MVEKINGKLLLRAAMDLTQRAGPRALVIVRGSRWWNYGFGAMRLLVSCHGHTADRPVFVIADEEVWLPESATARAIEGIPMPSPSPAALFERILSFVADDGLAGVPAIEPPMAIFLARGFMGWLAFAMCEWPCACALSHMGKSTSALSTWPSGSAKPSSSDCRG